MDSLLSADHHSAMASDMQSDDQALAREIAAGDGEAWERFFGRYSAWVYRFAYRHLAQNRADAEDLTSDVLITAARSMGQFDSTRGTLDLWLLGVARHRLARFCRERRMTAPSVPPFKDSPADPETPLADDLLETALTGALVNRALAGLPQRQAEVLIGKYVSGHTVEELARAAGTTPKAVESLLSRARAAFRSAYRTLSREGEDRGRNQNASADCTDSAD